RTGEINREGQAYLDFFVNTLMMPESLREVLRRPLGELKPGVEFAEEETIKEVIAGLKKKRPVMTLAVGDIVSLSSQRAGFESDTKIIDFRSRRLDISESYHRLLTAKKSDEVIAILKAENKAGTITVKAAAAIRQAVRLFLQKKRRSTIVVKGEEDLLTLPAILLAPLGAVVYYGQYDRGVVVVAVTEAVKRKVTGLIRAFSC
ncbi:DUF359 domain-containing protein, partial [Candidatus Roizmanbacteria bacterium]|nr:DUF359 domain-containing protein [Candidatus Roizmanbacteria bacterium]